MKIFGCKGYVLNKNPNKGKFDSRSEQCVFVGYSSESKAYRMWSPRKRDVIISRDVKFIDEKGFNDVYEDFCELENHDVVEIECENIYSEEIDQTKTCVDNNTPKNEIKTEKRCRGRPKLQRLGIRGRPKKLFQTTKEDEEDSCDDDRDPLAQPEEDNFEECELAYLTAVPDPVTFDEAMKANDATEWTAAIEDEYLAQIRNNTWEIVERPDLRKIISSRLVFRTKDGGKKKVRLVAKGYAQRPGEDFHETYSPVARSSSIRLLVALAAELHLEIHQMDVITAYLNGELEESVYIEVPQHLETILDKIKSGKPMGSNKNKNFNQNVEETADRWRQAISSSKKPVCMLKKALYGLRQSGLMWYYKLTTELLKLGLEPTTKDPCLFSKKEGDKILLILIYVDDLLLASNEPEWLNIIKSSLSQSFDMKDLGPVKRCLGIDFHQNLEKNQIFLSQRNYAESILERFGMAQCKPASTPMETNCKLAPPPVKDEKAMSKYPYQRLIGALMYMAVTTRPDIAFAVNYMSQFNSNYNEDHWKSAKRILRYIRGSTDYGLLFSKTNSGLYGVVDSDWGANITDRRSYSGYALILGGAAISWEARKQRTVSLSSTEAEYIAISEAAKETLYITSLLGDIGINYESVTLFNDSQSAQKLIKGLGYNSRTKHIDIRHHFVRDCIRNQNIQLEYLSTESMPADMLTKPVSKIKHHSCSTNLGLMPHLQ